VGFQINKADQWRHINSSAGVFHPTKQTICLNPECNEKPQIHSSTAITLCTPESPNPLTKGSRLNCSLMFLGNFNNFLTGVNLGDQRSHTVSRSWISGFSSLPFKSPEKRPQ